MGRHIDADKNEVKAIFENVIQKLDKDGNTL